VDCSSLADRDNKIGGEIVNLVGDEKAWRKMRYWPKEFGVTRGVYGDEESEDEGPQMPPSDSEEDG